MTRMVSYAADCMGISPLEILYDAVVVQYEEAQLSPSLPIVSSLDSIERIRMLALRQLGEVPCVQSATEPMVATYY